MIFLPSLLLWNLTKCRDLLFCVIRTFWWTALLNYAEKQHWNFFHKILKKKILPPPHSVDFAEIFRNANFWPNPNWNPVVKSEGGACLYPLQALYTAQLWEGISCHALHLVSSAASNYRHFVETDIGLAGWGCSSVVVCLPSKLKPSLGSIPSTAPPHQKKKNLTKSK